MKKFLLLIILLSNISLYSQKTGEIGFALGGSYYLGDVNHSTQFYSIQLAEGLFYRKNLNKRLAYRCAVFHGGLQANDSDFERKYQIERNHSFKTSLWEFSLQAEFNFFPYKHGSYKHTSRYTPYISSGLGFVYAKESVEKYHLILPISLGVKFIVSKKIEVGVEWSFRKIFSDNVDNFSGKEYDVIKMNASKPNVYKQKAVFYSKDWYSLIGFYFTFKLFQSGGDCKAYDY